MTSTEILEVYLIFYRFFKVSKILELRENGNKNRDVYKKVNTFWFMRARISKKLKMHLNGQKESLNSVNISHFRGYFKVHNPASVHGEIKLVKTVHMVR